MSETFQMTIPPVITAVTDSSKHRGQRHERTVVICLDGTGDTFDADNSNIVKFFAALKKDDPTQLTYYQSGVGTYSDSYKGSLKSGLSSALDMAVGASLGTHVREAYSFLMQNYREGDKICLFGFSRGAYTARALAGMLHKVGLLPAHNQAQIVFAYKWYKDDTENGWKMSADFKRTFSIDVNVYFLGCWDTVASVGIIPRILPFAKTNNSAVSYFRHALALDERRAKFKANHWYQRGPNSIDTQRQIQKEADDKREVSVKLEESFSKAIHSHKRRQSITPDSFTPLSRPHLGVFGEIPEIPEQKEELNLSDSPMSKKSIVKPNPQPRRSSSTSLSKLTRTGSLPADLKQASQGRIDSKQECSQDTNEKHKKEHDQNEYMKQFLQADAREFGYHEKPTDVLEVWFLGCHADCGGGAVPNETRHMLSRIPLRWMIRQTFACDTGLLFHSDVLAEHGLDVETLWPTLIERKAPCVGPSPSALDLYASKELPSLAVRRETFRRRSLASSNLSNSSNSMSNQSSGTPSFSLSDSITLTSTLKSSNNLDILPEDHEDYFDSLSPINDQLKESWAWWILEFIPVKYRVKARDGLGWKKKTGANRGRHRAIRDATPNLHWTVVEREKVQDYKIRCLTDNGVQWKMAY